MCTYKRDIAGVLLRAKARIVANWFQDRERGSFPTEVATPTKETTRVLLRISVESQWTIRKEDLKQASLHSGRRRRFGREVYLRPPPEAGLAPHQCWKAECALYGLDDGPLEFLVELDAVLLSLGLTRCSSARA